MGCQEVFNNILSNLEYDNVKYDVIGENGKTVICINCKDGNMRLTIEIEKK